VCVLVPNALGLSFSSEEKTFPLDLLSLRISTFFALTTVRDSSDKMVLQSSTNTGFDASGKLGVMILTLGLQ